MPDLPLIGGHAPGTSEKLESETCVNLFIEQTPAGQYLRNRYGYTEYGSAGFNPLDVANPIDKIISSGDVATVTGDTDVRFGYEVGDVVTFTGCTTTAWNTAGNWTITGGGAGNTFTVDNTENGAPPADETTGSSGTVALTSTFYNKEIRAMWWSPDIDGLGLPIVYVVVGNRVYTLVPSTGAAGGESTSPTDRLATVKGAVSVAQMGALNDDFVVCDGPASVAEGGTATSLALIGGTWAFDTLSASNTATFLDGYIIRDKRGSPQNPFLYSDLYNLGTESSFSYATAEGSFDLLQGVLADRRELWLFGDWTTEVWYNVGDTNNPFQRSQGGFIQTGIAAPLTAQKFDNSVMWLAKDQRGGLTVVRAADGYQPQMVSTPQINYLLEERREEIYNAWAFVMRVQGHEFYVLQIPGFYAGTFTPITLVYDSNTKAWFRWKSADSLNRKPDSTVTGTPDADMAGRWMVTAHLYASEANFNTLNDNDFLNVHLVGGRDATSRIYEISTTTHTDAHDAGAGVIECERTLSPVEGPDRSRVNAGPIELVTDQDPGEGGTVTLSYAKDGKTFTSGVSRAVGAATTSGRLMWKRVGRARRWIFRFTQDTTATVPVRWLRAISRALGGGL